MQPSVMNMSPEVAFAYVQRLREEGQFAVFDLPASNTFVQVIRERDGGVHVEVSHRTPAIDALLRSLGNVTYVEKFGFPTTTSRPGEDARVAGLIAQALALLAAYRGCANQARVSMDKQ